MSENWISMDSRMAETAVLGSVIIENETWLHAADLREYEFGFDSHRRIFRRMRYLAESGRPIDFTTLAEELLRHQELERIGGHAYLCALTDGNPNGRNIKHYVRIVKECATRRAGAKAGETLQRLASDKTASVGALATVAGTFALGVGASDSQPPQFSEEALALRFSRQYQETARYVHRWGIWMLWSGKRWVSDDTLAVFDKVRLICRTASAECGDRGGKENIRLASKTTATAVERLAQADRRHAATVEQWDADPWLLNTPAGTVDLRTGQLHPHEPRQYLTKSTSTGPKGSCRRWIEFLIRVTASNLELQTFLQRMVGYCLTGSTQEHALFFMFGTGANGKSVFLSTIAGVLGDYARTAPTSTFTATTTNQHPTDLAGLRGARFVTAIETEDGRYWAEAKVKLLTGGDRIAARFMRQDFFEYIPQFKLVVAGNHKPGLRAVDEAIRRRLHLIPFTETIPANERDPYLTEKLKSEYPGILQWAIEGCLEWQRLGLAPPEVVASATREYLESEDTIGQWIEERCCLDPGHKESGAVLYANYELWCKKVRENPVSKRRFAQSLEGRGFRPWRTNKARGLLGIALRGVSDTCDRSSD